MQIIDFITALPNTNITTVNYDNNGNNLGCWGEMVEIGNRLKRQGLPGLTPEDVEEETKIRKKYIMALELEQFEILPGPTYARAFKTTQSI